MFGKAVIDMEVDKACALNVTNGDKVEIRAAMYKDGWKYCIQAASNLETAWVEEEGLKPFRTSVNDSVQINLPKGTIVPDHLQTVRISGDSDEARSEPRLHRKEHRGENKSSCRCSG